MKKYTNERLMLIINELETDLDSYSEIIKANKDVQSNINRLEKLLLIFVSCLIGLVIWGAL